jgi:hypothetical protein
MKKKITAKDVSDSVKTKLINEYISSKNNTTRELSEKFNLPISAVDTIVNNHLKSFSK